MAASVCPAGTRGEGAKLGAGDAVEPSAGIAPVGYELPWPWPASMAAGGRELPWPGPASAAAEMDETCVMWDRSATKAAAAVVKRGTEQPL